MSSDFEEMFGEVVGTGLQATVYAKGDYAVKLYRDGYPKTYVFSEAYIMANLELVNFPGPKIYEILHVNGRYGLRMDRVKGELMLDELRDPARHKETLDALVDLQCRLQKYGNVGLAGSLTSLKHRFHNDLATNDRHSAASKKRLIGILDELPDGDALCHCDFHAANVFFDGKHYTVIDLLQICRGDPAGDAACSYAAYHMLHAKYDFVDEDVPEYYLKRYCDKSGIPMKSVLKWLVVYGGTLFGQVPEQLTPLLERFVAGDHRAA